MAVWPYFLYFLQDWKKSVFYGQNYEKWGSKIAKISKFPKRGVDYTVKKQPGEHNGHHYADYIFKLTPWYEIPEKS